MSDQIRRSAEAREIVAWRFCSCFFGFIAIGAMVMKLAVGMRDPWWPDITFGVALVATVVITMEWRLRRLRMRQVDPSWRGVLTTGYSKQSA